MTIYVRSDGNRRVWLPRSHETVADAIAAGEPRDPVTGELGAWVTINENGCLVVEYDETPDPETFRRTQATDAPADASATESRHATEMTLPDASEHTETATLRPSGPVQSGEGAPSDGVDRDSMADRLAAESPPPPKPPPITLPAPPEVIKRRRSRSALPDPVIEMELPFWDPRSGRFNGPLLRQAIVNRRWTIPECARVCGICPATLYNAVKSDGMSDRISGKILEGLGRRQPFAPIPEVANAR